MNVPISSVSLPQGAASAVLTEPPRAPAPSAAAADTAPSPTATPRATEAAAATAAGAAASSAPVDRDTLQGAVERVQQAVQTLSSAGIQFTLDQDFERMVVQVIDTSTKEVIRQIPPKEMLEIAQALDKLQGLLVHQKA
ncbi:MULTISPECIES: flagellar protein FlaG [Tepidiphilus]|uniref:FlaG protein n=1 Tax=Tepidiphilus thermophilus TaxID=876478 RepID=A0A0K6IX83_9PROT|nr:MULTISPECIES: flagellar protein FlaG [Tepidiphilus]CUB07730.1 FlaG protein [Tepidiphilus thermophilus]